MRILKLEAENLLNLRAVSVTFDPRSVRFTGKNGAGKSSMMNAIFYALAGRRARAEALIRRGADSATVRLDLGETETTYQVVLRVTPSGETVTVTAPNGAVFRKPQQMLEGIIGRLSFDPLAFLRMSGKERYATLRSLITLDVDIDALDAENERDFAQRTEWNREVKRLAEREAVLRGGVVPDMDTTPIDTAALSAEIERASDERAAIEGARERRASMARTLAERVAARDELKARIERLQEQLVNRDAEIVSLELALERDEMADAVVPDVTRLTQQLNEANRENNHREAQERARAAHLTVVNELAAAKAASEALTEAITERVDQKLAAFSRATLPITGLAFGDGDVAYNGSPFAQVSTGEATRVSVAIGMALNPTLRVIFVRDANLLDEDSLAIIDELADARDYQVFLESTQSTPTVGIHITAGEVTHIDGEPVGGTADTIDSEQPAGAAT